MRGKHRMFWKLIPFFPIVLCIVMHVHFLYDDNTLYIYIYIYVVSQDRASKCMLESLCAAAKIVAIKQWYYNKNNLLAKWQILISARILQFWMALSGLKVYAKSARICRQFWMALSGLKVYAKSLICKQFHKKRMYRCIHHCACWLPNTGNRNGDKVRVLYVCTGQTLEWLINEPWSCHTEENAVDDTGLSTCFGAVLK